MPRIAAIVVNLHPAFVKQPQLPGGDFGVRTRLVPCAITRRRCEVWSSRFGSNRVQGPDARVAIFPSTASTLAVSFWTVEGGSAFVTGD